mmetsp:Transcript_37116/g.73485  ORF Transcript_37116/g.73485 Transcript_37116/m.73485 type:complete len:283 (+) Transcript_37116:217-1065(+)
MKRRAGATVCGALLFGCEVSTTHALCSKTVAVSLTVLQVPHNTRVSADQVKLVGVEDDWRPARNVETMHQAPSQPIDRRLPMTLLGIQPEGDATVLRRGAQGRKICFSFLEKQQFVPLQARSGINDLLAPMFILHDECSHSFKQNWRHHTCCFKRHKASSTSQFLPHGLQQIYLRFKVPCPVFRCFPLFLRMVHHKFYTTTAFQHSSNSVASPKIFPRTIVRKNQTSHNRVDGPTPPRACCTSQHLHPGAKQPWLCTCPEHHPGERNLKSRLPCIDKFWLYV